MNLSVDYGVKLNYKFRQPRSLRACSRDDPECGARRGVLRQRLVTVCPVMSWKSPASHYDLAARSSLYGSGDNAGDGSAAPRPKTATVERREASVPRHGTQGASQAPGTPRYGVPHGCSAEHPNVSRRSAHPLIRGE